MSTPPQVPPTKPAEPPQTQPTETKPIPLPDVIDLASGNELDAVAAAELQRGRLVRLIVVAGLVDAGKTTLVTTLHDLFQDGEIGDYAFSWSETLPAFERRCHASRIASERAVADTLRTPYGEVRYLHLQISGPELRDGRLDLLFTDVSGETFERARDSIAECQQLDFLKMADHFLLLIDCEKIINVKLRNSVIHDATALLQSCLDSGMLQPTCFVNVLWTKYDFIVAANNSGDTSFINGATEEFQKLFGSRLGKLSFRTVAARPETVDVEFGHGISELLREWATESPRDQTMNLLPDETLGSRESQKFLHRHFNSTPDSK